MLINRMKVKNESTQSQNRVLGGGGGLFVVSSCFPSCRGQHLICNIASDVYQRCSRCAGGGSDSWLDSSFGFI